jgi:hypothetical protein
MTSIRDDDEQRWQQAAERPADDEPAAREVARYRAVYRAIEAAPLPEVPADFADAIERAVRNASVDGTRVHWSAWIAVIVLLVLLGTAAAPLLDGWARLPVLSSNAPWPSLLGAVAALAAWTVYERPRSNRAR